MMTEAEKNESINDATEFLYIAKDYVDHLRIVIKSIHSLSKNPDAIKQIEDLSGLGSFLGDLYHNEIDVVREQFEGRREAL